ncbi:unnamed protein product [Aphanomyces euteiches]
MADDAAPPPPPPPIPLRVDVEAENEHHDMPASPASMDDVDPTVLSELPADIRNEIVASLRAESVAPVAPSDPMTWECPMCTFLNHADLATCEMCEFCILDAEAEHDEEGAPVFRIDTAAIRNAAESAKSKLLSAFKASHDKNEEFVQSASAALSKVHNTAAKQLKELSAKLSPRNRVTSKERSSLPSPEVCLELDALRSDLKTACVAGDQVYESLLVHLWTALTDITGPFEREGEGWMNIGFQRKNPDTDFRGGGLLALKCLVYVCNMHPEKMNFLFRDQMPETNKRWYPVCVAGINITCMLAGLLKLGDGSFASSVTPYWPLFSEPNAFFELYYLAMIKMDQIWHRSHATYMQFGEVLHSTKTLIRYVLAQGPKNMDEFVSIADQIHVDDFKLTRRQDYFEDEQDLECPDPHRQLEEDGKAEGITALKYKIHQ